MGKRDSIGEWKTDPAAERAFALWLEYYDATENFDRFIGSPINERGVAIPVPGEQLARSNRFAVEKRKEVMAAAMREGISEETMMRERDRACDHHEALLTKTGRPEVSLDNLLERRTT